MVPVGQMTGVLSPFLERRRIAQALPFLREKRRILDVGCGRAALLQHLAPEIYVGLDILPSVVAGAQQAHPRHRFLALDVERAEVPLAGGRFDAIVMLAILEHFASPAHVLRKLSAALAESGVFVITTPHPWAEPIHRVGARLGLFSREAAGEHESCLNGAAIDALASECGLAVLARRRFQMGLNQLFVLGRHAPP